MGKSPLSLAIAIAIASSHSHAAFTYVPDSASKGVPVIVADAEVAGHPEVAGVADVDLKGSSHMSLPPGTDVINSPAPKMPVALPDVGDPIGARTQPVTSQTIPAPEKVRFSFQAGESFRNTMERWSKQSGWRVYWDGAESKDLVLPFSDTAEGETLPDALTWLFAAMRLPADNPLRVCTYSNKMLRMLTQAKQEC